jgi:hypothetical protein
MANINDELLEYLATEGLRPNKEEFGIHFRYQMLDFLVFWDEGDDHFLRVSIPNIFDVDDNNRFDVLMVCNELNKQRKVIKAIATEDSVWITAEQLLDQTPVYQDIIPRTLGMLLEARTDFFEKLKNL